MLIKSTRAGRLLHGRRRFPAGHPLAHRRRRLPRAIRWRSCLVAFLHRSASRRRPSTSPIRRKRASSSFAQVQAHRRGRRDLRGAKSSATLRCSSGRCCSTCCKEPVSLTSHSSTRRTPARCRRSGSRLAHSPIRSSCGVPHEHGNQIVTCKGSPSRRSAKMLPW